MNVEIGAEAALFPEKEYINGIFITVQACWVNSFDGFDLLFIFLRLLFEYNVDGYSERWLA